MEKTRDWKHLDKVKNKEESVQVREKSRMVWSGNLLQIITISGTQGEERE